MSDHEKIEQIGRLAEEVSDVKGRLAHVNETLFRAHSEYAYLSVQGVFQQLKVMDDGTIVLPANTPQVGRIQPLPKTLGSLLNEHELRQVLEEKQRLTAELEDLTARLKILAPHLF